MTDVNEFGALNWVKDELDETVHQARRALESYVDSEGDNSLLALCIEHLHQIAGVLQVVQIYGPGMLAEEMEAVARAMIEGRVRLEQDAAEALMLALIQLPDYLEKLQAGNPDVPLIILPLLNDLRAVRDAPLLSEAALFRTILHTASIGDHLKGEANPQLPELVRRLRQKFHIGLLGWFRQQQVEKGWQQLVSVFDELEKNAGTPQFYRLVWVSGALIRGLIDKSISSGIAVKQLFSQIDRHLKRIIDEGEPSLHGEEVDDLLKNLLYYIARAETDNPRIAEVKQAFNLEQLLPTEKELAEGRRGLSGTNAELVASISDAVQKELTHIKDILDLFMRKQDADVSMLGRLQKPMRQLSDTLGMIGHGTLRSRLLRQENKVQGFLDQGKAPEEYELMEMAGDILFIESSLGSLQPIQPLESVRSEDPDRWGVGLPETEYQELIKQTVREAKIDIAKVKEAIIGYTEASSEVDVINRVHAGIQHVCGALKILVLSESAQILDKTADFIKESMSDDQKIIDRQQLNFLADIISSIEYYLESLSDGIGNQREILGIAQSALIGLLHAKVDVQPAPAVGAIHQVVTSPSGVNEQVASSGVHTTVLQDEDVPAVDDEAYEKAEPISELHIPASEKPPLEDIDQEILEIFVEEAREELETIRLDLPAWLKNQEDKDSLISFRRSFHTLKGSGRLVGAKVIGELAWSVENMLNRVIDETIQPSQAMRDLLGDVLEILPVLIDCQEKNVHPPEEVDVDGTIQRAFAIAEGRTKDDHESLPNDQESDDQLESPVETLPTDVPLNADSHLNSGLSSELVEDESSLPDSDPIESPLHSSDLSIVSNLQTQDRSDSLEGFSDSDLIIEVDTELLSVFAEESENHLAVLERFIHLVRSSNLQPKISDEIIRAFHTMHGSARMTGITPIANLSKSIEELLKILAAQDRLLGDDILALLEESISTVRDYLDWLPGDDLPEPDIDSYLLRLNEAKDALVVHNEHARDLSLYDLETTAATDQLQPDTTDQVHEILEDELEAVDVLDSELLTDSQEERLFTIDEDPELVEIFQEEARELLEGINSKFSDWLDVQDQEQQFEIIRRNFHTLKGSARLAGVAPVGDLAQALERVFNGSLRLATRTAEPLIDKVKHGLEVLESQIKEIEAAGSVHSADHFIDSLANEIEQLTAQSVVSDQEKEKEDESQDPSLTEMDEHKRLEDSESVILQSADEQEDFSDFYAEPVSTLSDENLFLVGEDPELLEVFFEESADLIRALDEKYEDFSTETDDGSTIPEIQRILHTLKGSARLTGVLPVGDLSHALEDYFKYLSDAKGEHREAGMPVVRKSFDMLAIQIDEAESLGQVHKATDLVEELKILINSAESVDISECVESAQEESRLISDDNASDEGVKADLQLESVSYLQDGEYVEVGEDHELIEVFCEEAKEILEQLESAYQNWIVNLNDTTLIGNIQRSLHTLKGSARLAGILPVGDLSHAMESFLTKLMHGSETVTDSMLNLSRQTIDRLATQVDDVSSIGKVSLAEDLVQELTEYAIPSNEKQSLESTGQFSKKAGSSNQKQSSTDSEPETAVVLPFVSEIAKRIEKPKVTEKKAPFKASKDQVRISADLMDRLVNNAGEVSIYRARLEQQNSVLGFNLSELEQTVSRLHNQLRNLEIETEAQILYRWERDAEKDDRDKAEFDPLELDRFSNMQQLSRALVETVNDLGNINDALIELQRETDTLLLQQSRISTDLQDGLLRIRMVPFSQLVPRMQRLVRQTAEQTGKQAHLECFGAEGELDRNILNRMVPVLEHLLRNAVSHGIEMPSQRQETGKEEMGRISLYIDREGTNVLITLSDDGRGLDIEAIRRQAIKQGMISQHAVVSDDDLIQCVLNPGFSTAKEVTQISGRGVGLDVVASEVKQLGGNLEIDSQPSRGTSFSIRLPLTLAISDALLVRVGEEIYAIPHGSVEGVVRIRHKELQACYAGEQEHYTYANRSYKVDHLGHMMGLEQQELPEGVRWFPLLLVHAGEHNVAMQVDELLGTRQIVVKSIGKQAGSVRWINGGTILADGRIALILDVGALVRMDAARISSPVPEFIQTHQPEKERVRIMVVDDSITVRKVTGRLLERHDMDVITAKDGVEAVALLQEQVPDLMLLDIEMPRMDGFELARHINNSVDYYGLPIIMITSRVGDKHRKRAFDLGVKRCLGKPYQEAELLENIHQVLADVRS